MSNIAKLWFPALEVSGKNYMPWSVDVTMHLESMGISGTIKESNESTLQDKARSIIFLRKHIDEILRFEYLNTTDPSILWHNLKERFDHQKEVILPNARAEWMSLRFQDFKRVNDYNSALFRICSQLKFCGEEVSNAEMLEKTLSTFHASNMILQKQYRLQKFKKYSELNMFLLAAEQNNELLIKNHQSHPTGSIALPEANATITNEPRNNELGHGRGRGCGRGRGRFTQNNNFKHNHSYNRGRRRSYHRGRGQRNNNYHSPQGNNVQPKDKGHEAGTSQNDGGSCYRCGSKGHWSRTCCTPPYLCKLYQDSIKENGKEANLIDDVEYENCELNTLDFCNDLDTQES